MKIETKPVVTFTEKEYEAFNEVCMLLDDIIHGECSDVFKSIMESEVNSDIFEANPYLFYEIFATITNYAEEHRE